MRSKAQQALFRQNTTKALKAATQARPRTQPKDNLQAGETVMVWRNSKAHRKRGWTGPGVLVAISPTKTSYYVALRGCLLKCSGEQVRRATDAE